VVRNYIDWIISLPWYEYTEDKLEIAGAEQILDEGALSLSIMRHRIASTPLRGACG
jgi:ATP-dependent Lon protease